MSPSENEQQQDDTTSTDMQPPGDSLRPIDAANSGEDGAPMAVQTKDLPGGRRAVPGDGPWARRATFAIYGLTLILAVLAGYALIGTAVERGRVFLDDFRYGRPRTTHLTAMVGHGEERGEPTHIVAINLNRRVVLIELPGSDPNVTRVIEGPYLFGADQDLTPIELQLTDVDGDTTPDLLVIVRREQVVYLNKDGVFRLPTAAEQAELQRGKP
jgi:hypothetical protein